MFNNNELVLYSTEGVCRVSATVEKNFAGKIVRYYVLKPIYRENSTVFVPTDNELLLSKMRRVLSENEVHDIIQSIPDENPMWIDDDNTRKTKFKEIICGGNPRELVRLIKALYQHQQEQQSSGRKFHVTDERLLKDAEKLLFDEFAVVLKINPQQVLPLILEQTQAGSYGNQS